MNDELLEAVFLALTADKNLGFFADLLKRSPKNTVLQAAVKHAEAQKQDTLKRAV